jgi:hypothetical protein
MSDMIYSAVPRLSAEARIRDLCYELRCSNAFAASLCRVNPTVLSNALRGVKPLANEIGMNVLSTLTFLMQLSEALRPFVIPMSNAAETRDLIWRLQKAGVTPANVREGIAKILEGNQ